MLGANPFLQLVPARVNRALSRLEALIWNDRRQLAVEWTRPSKRHLPWKEASRLPRRRVQRPFFWGKLFEQSWFRLEIPRDLREEGWFLEWKEQGEATAYIGGEPFAGLDVGHHTCRLPAGVREIWLEVMCLESAIWVPLIKRPAITEKGCRFERACLVRRDENAWQAYHDLSVLNQLLAIEHRKRFPQQPEFILGPRSSPPHDRLTVLHRRLLRLLDEAVDALDREGVQAMRTALAKTYRELETDELTMNCILTGHAHIDLVWLWPERAGEFKAVHTFATMNRLMDEYPEFLFGYSQPASYRAVERRAPKLMRHVRGRIAEKRWEAIGASEVESDTLIACGEALTRSLLLGQDGFRDLTGRPSRILWLPDVFGYSACLPQILRQTGVDYFYTAKLTWGSITPFPHSSFVWQAADGTEVIAHCSPCFDYNGQALASEVQGAAEAYRQSDVHQELLMPVGFGDGGGGTTPEMCERARRMGRLAGLPRTQWGRVEDFFDNLAPVRDKLPVFRGELYLQYHRGIYTSHGRLKEAFRACERALQVWEAAHCAAGRSEIDVEVWRRLVFAQFHDYIPGSSIREVYEEGETELLDLAERASRESLRALTSAERGQVSLFNPLPVGRNVVVGDQVRRIGPLTGAAVSSLPVVENLAPVRVTANSLDNGRVKVRFDDRGRIVELLVDGKDVAIAEPLGDLAVHADFPHAHDAWDIDRAALSNGHIVESPARVRVKEAKSGSAVEFHRVISPRSAATIRYVLEAGSPVLGIEIELDFHDENTLLKLHFPTRYRGENARFGGPFGSVLRSQQPGRPYDDAQWEVPGSRWAAVSDDGEEDGLWVVTEAKYGWTCKSGQLDLSLLRSVLVTDDDVYPTLRTKSHGRFIDCGQHQIRLAIGHYAASHPREKNPALLADTLYTKPLTYHGGAVEAGLMGLEGGDSLIPSWAQPIRRGEWVLRLHETMGKRGSTQLQLRPGWQAQRVDLLGQPLGEILPAARVEFTPYELISVRLTCLG
jgi:alpha-mannosidase